MTLDLKRLKDNTLLGDRQLRSMLRKDAVIAYPTEAVFGLGCNPRRLNAVRKLLRIKGRPQHKGMILIADKLERFESFIAPLSPSQIITLNESWKNPLTPHTWLVPKGEKCPPWISGKHPSIAIRVTQHPITKQICRAAGSALVSTSANRAGGIPAKNYKDCKRLFGRLVISLPGHTAKAKRPSTIQDLITGKIIRK
jgi:L-threonylcarbamoyladenylate synthase